MSLSVTFFLKLVIRYMVEKSIENGRINNKHFLYGTF